MTTIENKPNKNHNNNFSVYIQIIDCYELEANDSEWKSCIINLHSIIKSSINWLNQSHSCPMSTFYKCIFRKQNKTKVNRIQMSWANDTKCKSITIMIAIHSETRLWWLCCVCTVQCIGGVVVQRGNQDRLLSGHDASESLSHCSVFGQSTYNSFYIHSTLFF